MTYAEEQLRAFAAGGFAVAAIWLLVTAWRLARKPKTWKPPPEGPYR